MDYGYLKTDTDLKVTFSVNMIIQGKWHHYERLRDYHHKGSGLVEKKYPVSTNAISEAWHCLSQINQTLCLCLSFSMLTHRGCNMH